MSLIGELQLQNGEAWVELFELDLSALGGQLYRFVPETGSARQPIVWQGNTYNPLPIAAEGFSSDGTGRAPRPKLRAANPAGVFSALAAQYGDFVRAKVTRKRTKVKYLDGVNFPVRRNLLTHTADFNSWTKAFISATQDGTIAPDGTTSGVWLLSKTDANTGRYIANAIGVPAQTQLTVSIYFRAGSTSSQVTFGIWQNSGWAPGSNPKVVSGPGAISLAPGTSRADVTGLSTTEWTQVSVTATVSTSSAATVYIYPGVWSSNVIGRAVYAYAPQVEYGSMVTDYDPVGAAWSRNPTADPDAHLDDDIFYVTRKSAEFPILELELGSPMELPGVSLPRRQIIANTCAWRYRSGECGYAGGPVANEFDQAVTVLAQDKCSHTVNGCKMRFGANAELPFGGFPGAANIPR